MKILSKYKTTTDLTFLSDQETLFDGNAYIEQEMIHSDDWNLVTPLPPYKTRIFKYMNYLKPPIPVGSEYLISKRTARWDDDDNDELLNYHLDSAYEAHTSGKSYEQKKQNALANRAKNVIMIISSIICLWAFVGKSIYAEVRSDAPPAPTPVSTPFEGLTPEEQESIEQQKIELERIRDQINNDLNNLEQGLLPPNVDVGGTASSTPLTQEVGPPWAPWPTATTTPPTGWQPQITEQRQAELDRLLDKFDRGELFAPVE